MTLLEPTQSASPTTSEAGATTETASIVITGRNGSGMWHHALLPRLEELIRRHSRTPAERLPGLVIDPKAHTVPEVQRFCQEAGRPDDFCLIGHGGRRYNLLDGRRRSPDGMARALAEACRFGRRDSWFEQTARQLADSSLLLIEAALRRRPTLCDLHKVLQAPDGFETALAEAQARLDAAAPWALGVVRWIGTWADSTWRPLDERTRTNVRRTADLIIEAIVLDPRLRAAFCPTEREETFPGFLGALEAKQVVVLAPPPGEIGVAIAKLVKLSFQEALIEQDWTPAPYRAGAFLWAEDYDSYVTNGDAEFISAAAGHVTCVLGAPTTERVAARFADPRKGRLFLSHHTELAWEWSMRPPDNPDSDMTTVRMA